MKKKGFTLIELLVVIAIIGILSTIGLVALNGAREKARDAQRQSDLAQVRTALSLYYDDNSFAYPAQEAAVPATDADCIEGDGDQIEYDATNNYATVIAAADEIVYSDGGALITTYLGAELLPPTISTDGWSHYCYDANDANSNTAYILFTQLEGGDNNWYWLDSEGGSDTPAVASTHTAANCSATTCTW